MSSGSNFSDSGFGGGPTFTHSLTNRESTKPGHVAAAAARRLLPGSEQAPAGLGGVQQGHRKGDGESKEGTRKVQETFRRHFSFTPKLFFRTSRAPLTQLPKLANARGARGRTALPVPWRRLSSGK